MRWLGFDTFGIALLRLILGCLVKLKIAPTTASELSLDVTQPICYVLPTRSFSDALMLDKACLTLNLPRPLHPIEPLRFGEKRALVTLSRSYTTRDLYNPEGRITARKIPRLERLITYLVDNPNDDIQIVPINIYWGRSPDIKKENYSFWKSVFSDTWSVPSALRKFMMILFHGRSTFIQVSEPLSLQSLIKEKNTLKEEGSFKQKNIVEVERVTRKLHRILRVHFRRQREAVVGPDLSHKRILVNQILQSNTVRNAMTDEVRLNDVAYRKAFQQARHYANEIASDYSHAVIRALDNSLGWLWHKIYNGIEVYNIDNLKGIANDYEVIYVPCHRSHIDYLLLSYVVYSHGLVPPHIAAGVNLNLPILGLILRRGGAFFMRRSFKGNPLYAAVFNEYLHIILKRGFSIEYFIEGGRSRTGRLLPPRKGMLSMTARSYLRDTTRPIMFVPVYIGYERLFEGASYVGELYGKKKKKESLRSLFHSLRKLSEKFGKVHVNFGQPIAINQIFDQHNPHWRAESRDGRYHTQLTSPKAEWLTHAVDSLAEQIITAINASAVINPVNLVSTALLATPKHAMDENALIAQIDLYKTLLTRCPYASTSAMAKFNGAQAIEQAEMMNILHRQQHPLGDLLFLDPQNAVLLTYFRNNVIHNFVMPSLIACYCLHNTSIDRKNIKQFIQRLYPFYRAEFFLHWSLDELDTVIDQWVNAILAAQLIKPSEILPSEILRETYEAPNKAAPEYLQLSILGNISQQSLKRYFIVLALLREHGSHAISADELEEQCHLMAQRHSFLFEFNAPEFFDKKLFRAFIATLATENFISTNDTGKIICTDEMESVYAEMRQVLGNDVRQAIRQVTQKIS